MPKQSLNLKRCLIDYPYYAANILHIKDADNQTVVPFTLNDPQWLLENAILKLRQEHKLLRIIVLKARQEGISTYTEGRIFWSAHLNENMKNVIIAHEKESGNAIFGMCKLFYSCLPKSLKPMLKYDTKNELVFENPDKKTELTNPGLRSSLVVLTAGKKAVARGTTINNLHCSEVASWQFPDDVIPSLLPTIPTTNDSLVVYESTAKGVGNFFHKEWLRAKNNESNFLPLFFPWFALSKYASEFNHIKDKTAFAQSLNDEEKELMQAYNLSTEQLYWRRLRIRDLGGDVELFRQEYPSTDTESFIVSGTPVFDRRKLRTMSIKCKEPGFKGNVDTTGRIIPDEHGELKIWLPPNKKGIYTIGVDVSDGGEGGDYSCIEVFQKLKAPYMAQQVAEWHGRIDPYNLAAIVHKMALLYNEALVAIETNAHGILTQSKLQERYWNLYRQENFDRFDALLTKKIGWETTLRTKKLIVGFMSHCVADMNIFIFSTELIRECMTFIRQNLETAGRAAGSGYDDRIMAAMISLFVMHQAIDGEPLDSVKFQTLAPAYDNTKAITTDTEFGQIIDEPYGDWNSSDFGVQSTNAWMNY